MLNFYFHHRDCFFWVGVGGARFFMTSHLLLHAEPDLLFLVGGEDLGGVRAGVGGERGAAGRVGVAAEECCSVLCCVVGVKTGRSFGRVVGKKMKSLINIFDEHDRYFLLSTGLEPVAFSM